jgi:hypothetical protein
VDAHSVIISWLPDPQLRADWPIVEAMLRPALSEPDDELFNPAIDVCWAAYEDGALYGAATTRMRTDGIAELRLAGGTRFREWIGLLDGIVTNWARDAGASRLNMRGRCGWLRFAARFGWVPLGKDDDGKMLFEKVLSNRQLCERF